MAKPRPVEPKVRRLIEALGLGEPATITFVKMPKVIFTVDEFHDGIRVVYSEGFLARLPDAEN